MVGVTEIEQARERIASWVHRTPLMSAQRLGEPFGVRLFLKAECLQKTGSFKPRGATNRVLTLSDAQRDAGLVTVSAGNHAQGLAYASGQLGVACTVVMPASAPEAKVAATRQYGATVELMEDITAAFARVDELVETGLTLAHPYDDPMVIAGQGTVGLEIADDCPDADVIVVPIGGGGLISGIATAVKARCPGARIVGVEPETSTAMRSAVAAGAPVSVVPQSIADGLGAPVAGIRPLAIVNERVDALVTVTDDAIAHAMGAISASAKLVTEPAGAAAMAGIQSGAVEVAAGETIVAVCSGGNVDLATFARLIAPSIER